MLEFLCFSMTIRKIQVPQSAYIHKSLGNYYLVLFVIMDFSAVANLSEFPEKKVIISKHLRVPPSHNSPRDLMKYYISSDSSAYTPEKVNINISNITPEKFQIQKNRYHLHRKVYEYVYKQDTSFEQTLRYHKEFRFLNTSKASAYKFTDNGKYFKIKRADFRRLQGIKTNNRCQTAEVVEKVHDFDINGKKRESKSPKLIKKELIPQTKACTVFKYSSPSSPLSVQGIVKDLLTRRCNHSVS